MKVKKKLGAAFERHRSLGASVGKNMLEDAYKKSSKKKLQYRAEAVRKRLNNQINYFKSIHVQEVQFSRYVSLGDGNI